MPKISKFSQKHAKITFGSKLKEQTCHKIKIKAICKTKICRKQANFN